MKLMKMFLYIFISIFIFVNLFLNHSNLQAELLVWAQVVKIIRLKFNLFNKSWPSTCKNDKQL